MTIFRHIYATPPRLSVTQVTDAEIQPA